MSVCVYAWRGKWTHCAEEGGFLIIYIYTQFHMYIYIYIYAHIHTYDSASCGWFKDIIIAYNISNVLLMHLIKCCAIETNYYVKTIS